MAHLLLFNQVPVSQAAERIRNQQAVRQASRSNGCGGDRSFDSTGMLVIPGAQSTAR
jgi:hypothetical protein